MIAVKCSTSYFGYSMFQSHERNMQWSICVMVYSELILLIFSSQYSFFNYYKMTNFIFKIY